MVFLNECLKFFSQSPSATRRLLRLGLAEAAPQGQFSSPCFPRHLQIVPSSHEHSPLSLSVH